ncbi:MAG: tetratricopeptide repeat protein [Aeoliella sp.]
MCAMVIRLCLSATSFAETTDQRYSTGLRERGLYRLAEVFCQQQLASGQLTPRQQAEMTIELALTAVSRAYDARAHQREQHWQQAHALLDSFLSTGDQPPFRLLIDLQDALLLLQHAELERLEQLDAVNTPAIELVKALLRQGIGDLRDVATEIERRRQQQALGRAGDAPEFTRSELDGLDRHVSLALARAYREQGLTYPPESADRINALQQATEALGRLANQSPADDIIWRARMAFAGSLGEVGRAEEGLALIAKWATEAPPTNIGARLLAAELQLLLRAERMNSALELLERAALPTGLAPELDLAHLQLLLAAKNRDTAAVDSLLATFRGAHGPRWVRRAEALVGLTFAADGDATSAAGQVHAAEHYYRAGKLQAAVAAYDRAAELHRHDQNREAAFAAERAAAAIVQQQQDFPQSAERFRRLALGSLDREDSADDHREAILCLAEAARKAKGEQRQAHLEAYIAACREHLRHWSAAATTEEVRFWLGQSFVVRKQWRAAVEILESAVPGSPHFEPAMELLAVAYRHQSDTFDEDAKRREWITLATNRLQRFITGSDNRWPAAWSDSQRHCALELARMQLAGGRTGAVYAEKMLRAAITGQPAPTDIWRSEAAPLLAMALVETGKTAEAIDWLRQLSSGNSEASTSLEPMVAKLASSLNQLENSDGQRAAVGQLILAAIDVAGEETDLWHKPADRYRATALAAVANLREARKLYETLVAAHPSDGDLQEEYARLLAASGDRKQALVAWTRVESGSRRGGERWLRARQARIDLLTQLGRQQEAKKLRQLTRVLYPGLGSE